MRFAMICVVVLALVPLSSGRVMYSSIPSSFFVDLNGNQNCLIVVGESADAEDIIAASRLAASIGESYSRKSEIPLVEEVGLTYEDVKAGSCIVVTPAELPTLWYFDDFGVYGNGNERFDLWETHEEIQLYIEDIPEYDPFLRVYRGNGWLDFSTIYRIDNVRAPPYRMVYSHVEAATGQYVTDLQFRQIMNYSIIDPYFVYYGYLPKVKVFREVYTVVYIDSGLLITGEPHLKYVYVYGDEPFTAGDYTITLKDVDVDHNKCYLQVSGSGVRDEFWMVLDPLHGFSSGIQEMSAEGYVSFDFDQDGVTDHIEKTVAGDSELDVWGHSMGYRVADLVIDGIKIFIGESIGVYLGVYWVEDIIFWHETTCCQPFVIYPDHYDFQIRPDSVMVRPSQDAYVDQSVPLTNFGGLSSLSVRSFLNANTRSFIKFDMPTLPSKALVYRATLRLQPLSILAPRVYEVSRVTALWSESGITWLNQPAAVLTGTQINNLMEWDVTSDVQAFYSGTPNYGWSITDQSENSLVLYETLFGSRESAAKPQLIIEYTFDCNYLVETIPHVQNWIDTFYDDMDNDGVRDPVYEIDISLCEPIKMLCDSLFFEGPNYYYFVDFWNTSFEDGVDFELYQKRRVGTYKIEEVTIQPWNLIKLDSEVTEREADLNWILIGGVNTNTWTERLVAEGIFPDDGTSVKWFLREPGYKMYTDPFGYGNRILLVAGNTSKDTQKAVQMLIEDMKGF